MEIVLAVVLVLLSAVACLTQSMPVLKLYPPPNWLSYVTYRSRLAFAVASTAIAIWLAREWAYAPAGDWVAIGAVLTAAFIWATLVVSPAVLFHPRGQGTLVSAEDAAARVGDDEEVIGVVVGTQARAYVTDSTNPQHVLSDEFGGQRLMISWCVLCHNAAVFKGDLDGKPLKLRVIGGGNNNVLFYDSNSKNLVQQITGHIVAGPDKGRSLQWIPSVTTTWSNWRRQYPDSTLWLGPERNFFDRLICAVIAWAQSRIERKQKPFYAMNRPLDSRFEFTRLVSGVTIGGARRGYLMKTLADHPVVNDSVGQVPIVVFSGFSGALVRFFDRRIKHRVLTFEQDSAAGAASGLRARDNQTGSTWDQSGAAIDGPLEGAKLREIPGVNRIYWGAFGYFYPGATVWAAEEPKARTADRAAGSRG